MLAGIAEANLAAHPERQAFLNGRPGVIEITAVDADVVVTLEFRDGRLRVYSGERTAPSDVRIFAPAEAIPAMPDVPQIGPLPDPFRKDGREAWKALLTGAVKLKGAARNRKLLQRMRGLMSVGRA
jgi:hypothetical protein